MGDTSLESEVLEIFLSQCQNYLDEFKAAENFESRRRVAHRIKGTARGLGAWELAEVAEEAEAPEFSNIKALEAAAYRVSDYIRQINI